MTSAVLLAVAVPVGTGLVTAVLTRLVLRHLPEPADGAGKPRYADLGTPRFVAACGVLAGLGAAISWSALPRAAQPPWLALAVLGVLLVAIDARTTWLPLRLTRLTWGAGTVAILLAAALDGGGRLVLRAGLGALVAGVLYLLVWLVSRGGLGFGDVRLAPVLGAVSAASSWRLLVATLFLGSLLGGGWGVVRLVRRRREPFPYAPSMLAGAYLACVLDRWWP